MASMYFVELMALTSSACDASPRSVTACTLRRKTGYPQWSEWLSVEKYSGGAVVNLLIHDIDQALTGFGPPDSVTAVGLGLIDTMRTRRSTLHNGSLYRLKDGDKQAIELSNSAGYVEQRAYFR